MPKKTAKKSSRKSRPSTSKRRSTSQSSGFSGSEAESSVNKSITIPAAVELLPVLEPEVPVALETVEESPAKVTTENLPEFRVDAITSPAARGDLLPDEVMSPFLSPSVAALATSDLSVSPMTGKKEDLLSNSPVMKGVAGSAAPAVALPPSPLRESIDMATRKGAVYVEGDITVTVQGEPVSPYVGSNADSITMSPKSLASQSAYPASPATEFPSIAESVDIARTHPKSPLTIDPVVGVAAVSAPSPVAPVAMVTPTVVAIQTSPDASPKVEGASSPTLMVAALSPALVVASSSVPTGSPLPVGSPSPEIGSQVVGSPTTGSQVIGSSPTIGSQVIGSPAAVGSSPKTVVGSQIIGSPIAAAPASTATIALDQTTSQATIMESALLNGAVINPPQLSPPRTAGLDSMALAENGGKWHSIDNSSHIVFLPVTLEEACIAIIGSKVDFIKKRAQGEETTQTAVSGSFMKTALFKICGKCVAPKLNSAYLTEEEDIQKRLANTPFNAQEEMHRRILSSVYSFLTGDESPGLAMVGAHWERVGFMTADPAEEVNKKGGSGMLALLLVLFLAENFAQDAHALFAGGFPFCSVAIAAADSVTGAASKGGLNTLYNTESSVLAVSSKLFVGLMLKFGQEWKARKLALTDLPEAKKRILAITPKNVSATLAAVPHIN